MIAVDTSVLARFIVEDDSEQTNRADALFRRAAAKGLSIFVSDVVLCELVWVLATAYKVPRAEIASALANLTRAKQIEIGNADLVYRALAAYRAGKGDFADYVIREHALAAGCSSVATFDKRLWAEPVFAKA